MTAVWWDGAERTGHSARVTFLMQRQGNVAILAKDEKQLQVAYLDGPYGHDLKLQEFENIFLAAKGIGIAGILPYAMDLAQRQRFDEQLVARTARAKESTPKEALFRDKTRRIDLFWVLDDNSQQKWMREELQALQNLDPRNRLLCIWCIYPSPGKSKPPFEINDYWRCLYPTRGSDFHKNGIFKEIAKGANSPGRTIVVGESRSYPCLLTLLTPTACGDALFTGSIRDEAIRNASMQFAEVEFRPSRVSQEPLAARATPLRRLRKRRSRVSDPESLALAREGRCGSTILSSNRKSHDLNCEICTEYNTAVQRYLKQAAEALDIAREEFQQLVQLGANASPATRIAEQGNVYFELFRKFIIGDPITACQYLRRSEFKRTEFVICSTDEAKVLLEARSPQVPILTLAELNKDVSRLPLDRYLDYLRAFPTLDIHDFQDVIPDGVITPRSVDSATAIALFRNPSRAPINMLNLRGYKTNPVPSCLAGLPNYAIMEYARGQSGKLEKSEIADLTESATFQICGKKGAYSMPHIDRHGVHTALFDDDGLKLWAFWPAAELVSWAESGCLPSTPGISLYLYPGCTLLQPRGTIHAPYSMTDVLMSGTMHWDSREMLGIMQLSQLEARYPHITNEDMAKEFVGKVGLIRDLWQSKSPAWSWGSDGDFAEYSKLVKATAAYSGSNA
ncbi:hypothetical protein PG999_005452 [Apiospora kogelbergensis]|uniref:Ferric reductase NAD binding domain-containing protein n=1 Tax=Apiospora kogelbergensis TaxID=1337665 RepID=A0AAW0R253_9PEZI